MSLKKWKLISTKDVSPSKWFPIESRQYELPNGTIVDDFTVTTLADVAMIIPVTKEGKVVLVKQFKPGIGEMLIQFPAGRIEKNHHSIEEAAQHELEEEVGVRISKDQLHFVVKLHAFSTKATEVVHIFLATDCLFNSAQNLDENEEIEILQVNFTELDQMILTGEIWDAEAIAGWELTRKRFPSILR